MYGEVKLNGKDLEEAPAKPATSRLERILNDIVFESRWVLYPIILGLIAATVVYVIRFLIEDISLLVSGISSETEHVMVAILGLVDIAMVANLLVMTTQGSYQIFIRRFEIDVEDRPQWLDHVDSGILKIKIALSVAGITLIRLLKDFVNMEHVEWVLIQHRIIVHIVCLGSAIAMAVVWRLTRMRTNGNGH
jgi:uncharacterized protein (TIGR00645 family)